MIQRVSVDRLLDASRLDVWKAVEDIESFPSLMRSVKQVLVSRREGAIRESEWSVLLKGSTLCWSEVETIDPDAGQISFEQVDGDLKIFRGHWRIEDVNDQVRVQFDVEFEIGIPLMEDMLNPVARRALRENSNEMLDGVEASSRACG